MPPRISFFASLIVLICGFGLVGSVSAHAKYLRSEPGDGALINMPPARVDIWFAQELFRRQGENRILVFDPQGQPVQVSAVQIDNDDRKHLWGTMPALFDQGRYRVEWSNLSAEDGDPDQGSFSFTFDPNAAATSATPVTKPLIAASAAVATSTPGAVPATAGGNCLPGMLPVAGMLGAIFLLGHRRSEK